MRDTELMKKVLPDDTEKALHKMITYTEQAIVAFTNETNALAVGQELSLAQYVDSKKVSHQLYQAAACEFMARRDEFVDFGGALISKLKTLQSELKIQAQVNMSYWEPMIPKKEVVSSQSSAKG